MKTQNIFYTRKTAMNKQNTKKKKKVYLAWIWRHSTEGSDDFK